MRRVCIAYCVLKKVRDAAVGVVAYCVLRIAYCVFIEEKVTRDAAVGVVAYCVLRIAYCVLGPSLKCGVKLADQRTDRDNADDPRYRYRSRYRSRSRYRQPVPLPLPVPATGTAPAPGRNSERTSKSGPGRVRLVC